MDATDRVLDFLVQLDEEEVQSVTQGTKGLRFSRGDREFAVRPVSAQVLRSNLAATITALQEAFVGFTEMHHGLPLKQVELSFEISASGKITLLGTGVETAGKGGITLTFGQ